MTIKFEWDKEKSESNLTKHNVSFEESKSVFNDDFARVFDDPLNSINEFREIIFGYSNKNRLLVFSYTERNDKIRIISARKVTKNERKLYEEF
ncbi:MAG: BrnT family toxin [Bacteroidetes bacterium]|nr:BrnT family toxin [Bacteroidota bacterium]